MFRVGDAVIRKWNGELYYLIVDIDNDGQEFLIHRNKDAKFKDCKVSDNTCNFTHATPEEIAAGHRIDHFVDINEMIEDSHIENHISPHFKKYDERVNHDNKT